MKVLLYILGIGMIALVCGHPFLYDRGDAFLFLGWLTGLAIVWCIHKEQKVRTLLCTIHLKLALCVWVLSGLLSMISMGWEWHALVLFFFQVIFLSAGYLINIEKQNLYKLVWVIYGCIIFLGLYSWIQFIEKDPLPPATIFRSVGRVVATFDNPNHLGNFFACVLCVLCITFLVSLSRLQLIGSLGLCGLCYCGILLTGSRGAWVSALVGVFTLLCGMLVRGSFVVLWRRYVMLLLQFIAITWFLSDSVLINTSSGPIVVGDRLRSTEHIMHPQVGGDKSISHRFWIWNITWQIIEDAPFWGHGVGSFDDLFIAYRATLEDSRVQFEDVSFAHNEFLHLWVECGIIGVVAYSWFIILVLYQAMKYIWHTEDVCVEIWGAIGIVVVMLLHSMVSYPLHLEANSLLFWLSLGTLVCRTAQGERR